MSSNNSPYKPLPIPHYNYNYPAYNMSDYSFHPTTYPPFSNNLIQIININSNNPPSEQNIANQYKPKSYQNIDPIKKINATSLYMTDHRLGLKDNIVKTEINVKNSNYRAFSYNNKKGSNETTQNTSQHERYKDLMCKLDQIIEESRKTQEMIKEKQLKVEKKAEDSTSKPMSPEKNPVFLMEIDKILADLNIPKNFQNNLINNITIKKICHQNLYETKPEISSPQSKSHKLYESTVEITRNNEIPKEETTIINRINQIKAKSGFDMMKFIEDLYSLTQNNEESTDFQASPVGKKEKNKKIANLNGFDRYIDIFDLEEDFEWKKLDENYKNYEENVFFYKENLVENVEANYFSCQAMEKTYEKLMGVYLKNKAL